MKNIQVHVDSETQDKYFDLQDFKDLLDISLVDTYSLEQMKDGCLILKFYDKDKKEISINQNS